MSLDVNNNQVENCISFPTYKNRMSLFEVLPATYDAVVFVGDSLTQRNQWSEFFSDLKVLNRGIDSDRVAALLLRLDSIISLRPCKVFLMIGINDVYDRKDDETILKHYETVICKLKNELPNTRLYIQSLLPVNNSVYSHPLENDAIQKFNLLLELLANKHDVTFINLHEKFLSGKEMDAMYTDDGCHLSGQGYRLWVKQIESYVYE